MDKEQKKYSIEELLKKTAEVAAKHAEAAKIRMGEFLKQLAAEEKHRADLKAELEEVERGQAAVDNELRVLNRPSPELARVVATAPMLWAALVVGLGWLVSAVKNH